MDPPGSPAPPPPGDAVAVAVAVRLRPLNAKERAAGESCAAWAHDARSLWTVAPPPADHPLASKDPKDPKDAKDANFASSSYTFDYVFGQDAHTALVYNTLASAVVDSCMDGVNGTIFAYGQTSSGKTHTMMGDLNEPGIILLAISHVFDHISKSASHEFLLRVSYLEIYNEVIRDLLDPSNINLKIHENVTREIFVGNLSEHIVHTPAQIHALLTVGERNRHIGETNMNEKSSRSHTIFKMVIESRAKNDDANGNPSPSEAVKVSHLNLVDLAGSERVGHTGAEGMRLKEGGHINKSLLALANVIGKLSEGGDKRHIPYRNSKLTRILQPSLGGNAKTAIICTATPAAFHIDETHSTLRFASRAKTIINKPLINENISDETLLKRYRREIEVLKQQLAHFKTTEQERASSPASIKKVHSPTNQDDSANTTKGSVHDNNESIRISEKLEALHQVILSAPRSGTNTAKLVAPKRRRTWYPGVFSNPVASDWVASTQNDEHLDVTFGNNSPRFKHKTSLPLSTSTNIQASVNLDGDSEISHRQHQNIMTDRENNRNKIDKAEREMESQHITQLQTERNELEIRVSQLDSQLRSAASGQMALETELNDQVTRLQTERDELKTRVSQLDDQLRSATSDRTAVEAELSDQITQLRTERNELEKRVSQLDGQLRSAASNRTAVEAELGDQITQLQSERDELKTRVSQLDNQLLSAASDRTALEAELSDQITRIQTERDELETRVLQLDNQLRSSETDRTALEAELSDQITQLRTERNELEKRVMKLDDQLRSSETDQMTVQTELSDQITRIQTERDELETRVLQLDNQLRSSETDRTAVEAELSDQITQLQIERNELEKRVSQLDDQLRSSTSDKMALETDLNDEITQFQMERNELEKRVSQLDDQLRSSETDRMDLDAELSNQITQLQTERDKLETRVSQLDSQLRSSETDRTALETELSNQITQLQLERDELEKRLMKFEKQLRLFETDRSALEAELSDQIVQLQTERDELETRVLQLENHLRTATSDRSALEAELGDQITQLQSERNELETRVLELHSQLRSATLENQVAISDLHNRILQADESLSKSNALCQSHKKSYTDLKKSYDDLVDEHSLAITRIKEYVSLAEDLRASSEKLQASLFSKQRELESHVERQQMYTEMEKEAQQYAATKTRLETEASDAQGLYVRARSDAERLAVLLEDEREEAERARLQHLEDLDFASLESKRLETRIADLLKELAEVRANAASTSVGILAQNDSQRMPSSAKSTGNACQDACIGTSDDPAFDASMNVSRHSTLAGAEQVRTRSNDHELGTTDEHIRKMLRLEQENDLLRHRLRESHSDLANIISLAPDKRMRVTQGHDKLANDRDSPDSTEKEESVGSLAVATMGALLEDRAQQSDTACDDEFLVAKAKARLSRQEADQLRNELNTTRIMLANERTLRRQLELQSTEFKEEIRQLRSAADDASGTQHHSNTDPPTARSKSERSARNNTPAVAKCSVTRAHVPPSISKPPAREVLTATSNENIQNVVVPPSMNVPQVQVESTPCAPSSEIKRPDVKAQEPNRRPRLERSGRAQARPDEGADGSCKQQ